MGAYDAIAIAAAFLLLVAFPLWGSIGEPGGLLPGWVLAAYAVVFTALAAYRAEVERRGRRAFAEAIRLAHRLGEVESVLGAARGARAIEQLAMSALPVGILLALVHAPQEQSMKALQRIFYVHVPSAWVAFLAFGVVFVASVIVLARRRGPAAASAGADRVAQASAEVGVVFTSLVLVTGPIWAKPAWGIWWTWDARLTLTLVLWMIYVGYLMVRAYVAEPERQATLAAVVGVLGFVGVPIDYMAIRWWRTQHPAPVLAGDEKSGLDPAMKHAFYFQLAVFTLIYLAFLLRRIAVAKLEADNDERHRRLEARG